MNLLIHVNEKTLTLAKSKVQLSKLTIFVGLLCFNVMYCLSPLPSFSHQLTPSALKWGEVTAMASPYRPSFPKSPPPFLNSNFVLRLWLILSIDSCHGFTCMLSWKQNDNGLDVCKWCCTWRPDPHNCPRPTAFFLFTLRLAQGWLSHRWCRHSEGRRRPSCTSPWSSSRWPSWPAMEGKVDAPTQQTSFGPFPPVGPSYMSRARKCNAICLKYLHLYWLDEIHLDEIHLAYIEE